MKIFYIFIVIIIFIVINSSVPKYSYKRPRIDSVIKPARLSYPRFFVDFPSAYDRILPYNENLYGDFAR
jgi:hypothetical protein